MYLSDEVRAGGGSAMELKGPQGALPCQEAGGITGQQGAVGFGEILAKSGNKQS